MARAGKHRGLHLLPVPHLFSPFKVISSVLSPHLSRRWMRNQPCAAAYVRAGSFPLSASRCNLNSIQHSPFLPPLPTRILAANVEKGDLNFRQKKPSPPKKGEKTQQVAYNIFTSLLSACFIILTPRARHPNVKPARFYFKILGRGGENSKRLRSYLLPSRIQDHRS